MSEIVAAGAAGMGGIGGVVGDEIQRRLLGQLGAPVYERYFGSNVRFSVEDGAVRVRAANRFIADCLERRFRDPIATALSAALKRDRPTLTFDIVPESSPEAAPTAAPTNTSATTPGAAAPSRRPAMARTAEPPPARTHRPHQNPNRLRRLEDFIVGQTNRLAYEASLRLCAEENPAHSRLLFVYGDCGVGKTHLLQGAARRFCERSPGLRWTHTTGEAFTNRFITALRKGDVESFRRAYRGVDLLCIDDVHFLASKNATQTELLHTFEAATSGAMRIMVVSDEHPSKIDRFSRELVSRFMAGLIVRVDAPDEPTRMQIAGRIAQERGVKIEREALELLARRCTASVRVIEGALARVEAFATIENAPHAPIGTTLVERALGERAAPRSRRFVKPRETIERVCEELGVEPAAVLGPARHQRVVLARSLSAHLMRNLTTMSFPDIAASLNRPSHSTVVTACKRIERKIAAGESVPAGGGRPATSIAALAERLETELVGG